MKILKINELPLEFETLIIEASNEGHLFLSKMQQEWISGINKFNHDKEILFSMITTTGELAGIGGLNIDPYLYDPTVGRVRHVYVKKKYRRQGAGKILVQEIIEHAKNNFRLLRLKTHNPLSVAFYKSLGFVVDLKITNNIHTCLELSLGPTV